MNRRHQVESAVIAWIWPTELANIVAEYAVPPPVRWSAVQTSPTIRISDDGSTAELTDGSEDGVCCSFGGHAYVDIIGRRPLTKTATDWTVQLTPPVQRKFNELIFRIGIRSDDRLVLSPPIVFKKKSAFTVSLMRDSSVDALAGDPSSVRFSLSADLETGTLTTRVWSATSEFADVRHWFSATMDPAVLAMAIPIVYGWYDGTRIDLLDEK